MHIFISRLMTKKETFMQHDQVSSTVNALLSEQVQAVLATSAETGPMMHLMAYAYSDDLRHIYLASKASTRKVENLLRHAQCSLLWDNRSGHIQDHIDGYTCLAECQAKLVDGADSHVIKHQLLKRNATLTDLLTMNDCCIFSLTVRQYNLTLGYKQTFSWCPSEAD